MIYLTILGGRKLRRWIWFNSTSFLSQCQAPGRHLKIRGMKFKVREIRFIPKQVFGQMNLQYAIGRGVRTSLLGSYLWVCPSLIQLLSHFIAMIYMFVSSLDTELLEGRED